MLRSFSITVGANEAAGNELRTTSDGSLGPQAFCVMER